MRGPKLWAVERELSYNKVFTASSITLYPVRLMCILNMQVYVLMCHGAYLSSMLMVNQRHLLRTIKEGINDWVSDWV